MPTVHRQLRDWCSRRGYRACDSFAERLDNVLREREDLSPEILLWACRRARTIFFRENRLDREEVAQELTGILELPPVRSVLVKLAAAGKHMPRRQSAPEPDLFISYYHKDADFVQRLAKAVAASGYSVWYDKIALTAGDVFPREIEKALTATRYIGFVCTAGAIERPWVRMEIDAGLYREGIEDRNIIIPLRLAGCSLPPLLASKQWCDFAANFKGGLADLIATLAR